VVVRLWPTTPLAAWLEGQRSLSPPGRFPWCARVAARRPGRSGGRLSHQARAWARPGELTLAGWRKRREGIRYGG
jgi:hypothetical protein